MRLERVRPTAVQVTLHPLELATLISTARWVVAGAPGPLPPGALGQLRQVLDSYDAAAAGGLDAAAPAERPETPGRRSSR